MNHQEHIKEFRAIWETHGRVLTEEEATEEFYRLLAFMRLILKWEHKKQKEQYDKLFKENIADIISH